MFAKSLPLCCLLLLSGKMLAQHSDPDARWPIGMHEYPGLSGYGNAWLYFRNGTVSIEPAMLNMNFESAVAVASDSAGSVLFYTNGCEIRDGDGEMLENGADLNPGALHDWVCPTAGYTAPKSMMALAIPGQATRWLLLHLGGDYDPVRKVVYGPFYHTEIDMAANSGKGAVVSKNQVASIGDLEPFAAVRHGNGRDWWIILPEYGANRYQRWLLNPEGLNFAGAQAIGSALTCRRMGASVFSPDGSKYARTQNCGTVVLDFDRCTGTFSNPVFLERPTNTIGGGGLAFTADNRWLFATSNLCLFKADLLSSAPVFDSLFKRPYFEGETEYVYGTSLTYMQAAPDGNIYINARHRERYFSGLIALNDSFKFAHQALKFPVANVRTLPHFPNFRLYDLPNSLCDTLGIDGPVSVAVDPLAASGIRVYPNPFCQSINLQIPFDLPSASLGLYDQLGCLIHYQALLSPGEHSISADGLPSGIYFWQIAVGPRLYRSGKLIKIDR